MAFVTRFAPSPTGPLHLGHAYSAMLGFDLAMREGGDWLLRIEDIDRQRSRPEWEAAIYRDLEWLGLWWPEPVMRQSERINTYSDGLRRLNAVGDILYRCDCRRSDIAAALDAPQEGAPLFGPDGPIYPGTCRTRKLPFRVPAETHSEDAEALELIRRGIEDMAIVQRFYERLEALPEIELQHALRLRMDRAFEVAAQRRPGEAPFLEFRENGHGPAGEHGTIPLHLEEMIDTVGDVVLARRDMGTSYHLSVVLDDAAQGVTHVVRGEDLFEATRIHVLLQHLFDLPTPIYHHHRLIRDEAGKRLAKRDDARAIAKYRAEGATAADIRRMVGLPNP
ncbi:tRNA glutamyl-Q(34) synthetase GluQRS [Tabrizicola sp.]|uniref:tRNA glutamyl-Q(34) synthetase GluQRS n=1 Tax=Tabrizicola sp. TaxID=2005166 RepID=UPI001A58797F|nr:tRNA glutamyl-Q(34) synthetase GluQRS [Tabrizicola sp.]MBL9072406.1 tRNA glutamyl-Q(34) synthetase GluQRS [Tabrizicola sp.]